MRYNDLLMASFFFNPHVPSGLSYFWLARSAYAGEASPVNEAKDRVTNGQAAQPAYAGLAISIYNV